MSDSVGKLSLVKRLRSFLVGVRLSSATVMTSYCARSSTGRVEFPARKQCRGEGRTKPKISVPNLQAMAEHDRSRPA